MASNKFDTVLTKYYPSSAATYSNINTGTINGDPYDTTTDTTSQYKTDPTSSAWAKYSIPIEDKMIGNQTLALRVERDGMWSGSVLDPTVDVLDSSGNFLFELVKTSYTPYLSDSNDGGIYEYVFDPDEKLLPTPSIIQIRVTLNVNKEILENGYQRIYAMAIYANTIPSYSPETLLSYSNVSIPDIKRINTDPDGMYPMGNYFSPADNTSAMEVRLDFPSSSFKLSGTQEIRMAVDFEGNPAGRNGYFDVTIYDGSAVVYKKTEQSFNPIDGGIEKHSIEFDASLLSGEYGENLEVGIKMVSAKDGMFYYGWRLGKVEWNVNIYGKPQTVVAPDTPIIISPDNGETTGSVVFFGATLNDSDDPSIEDEITLVVDYSQDQTFASGVVTVQSSPVPPSAWASAPSNPMENGIWYWRAKAVDSGGLESGYTEIRNINVSNTIPDVPTNLLPTNNGEVGYLKPTFSANVSDIDGGTVMLEVEYSTSDTLSSNVVKLLSTEVSSSDVASVSPSENLIDGTVYYWRARAFDGILYSDYTQIQSFLVDNKPANLPTNLSPANNVVITTNSFTISATASDPEGDTVTIEYQLSEYKDFSVIKQGGVLTNGIVSGLSQGNYYWRVRAKDSLGQYSAYTTPRGVYVDTPSIGRLSPDSVLSSSNLSNADTVTLGNDPDNTDSTWAVTTSGLNSNIRVSFGAPPVGGLKVGSNLQEFRVRVRSTNTSATMSATVKLYENGVEKASSSTFSVASEQVLSFNWDAGVLANQTGASVECQVETISATTGKSKGQIDIGAIEWNYEVNSEPQDPAEEIAYPIPNIVSISRYVISDETGADRSTIRFTFDIDVSEWRVNVLGTSWDSGTIAHSYVGNVNAGVECVAEIDFTELYQEGPNKINIYGKSSSGLWTPYEPDETGGTSGTGSSGSDSGSGGPIISPPPPTA